MTIKTKPIVVVGLSGGVDSSVSALLLKKQGFEVHGLFMKNWEEDDTASYCAAQQDLEDVKAITKALDIPLHTANFSEEYWQQVFSLFLEEYQAGRTPNPDILCNKEIKFKTFLEHALKLGADFIATGHYVQKGQHIKNEQRFHTLLKGNDLNKDQSYFLYTLGQYELQHALFPIGHLEKPQVRELAKKAKLITHNKKDSTGICFVGKRNFKTFLQDFLVNQPGMITTVEGIPMGEHDGLMYYTLGQRHGLKIGGKKGAKEKPWYVVAKDLNRNLLIVTQESEHPWHYSTLLMANQVHWTMDIPLSSTFKAHAKIRYRQADQACEVQVLAAGEIMVKFNEPQKAVTPGQSIVLYDGSLCLGGGIIQFTDSPGGLLSSKQITS